MEASAVRDALRAVGERELGAIAKAADALLAAHPVASGGLRTRLRDGHGLEFLEYRTYVPGDDLRNLDWRATLRRRQPQIRRFSDEAYGRWFVCLDQSASMAHPDAGKWLLTVQLCAAWAYLLLRAGHWVSLISFGSSVAVACRPGRGSKQFQQILAYLSQAHPEVESGTTDLAACTAFVGAGTCAVVLSDFLAEDALTGGMNLFRQRGVHVQAVQVLSRDECSCPEDEPLILVDAESGASLPVTLAPQGTAVADARLSLLQRELADSCRERGFRLTQCRTGEAWSSVLLRHFAPPPVRRA